MLAVQQSLVKWEMTARSAVAGVKVSLPTKLTKQFTETQVNNVASSIATIAKFVKGSPSAKLFTASQIAEAVMKSRGDQLNKKSGTYEAYRLAAANVLKRARTYPDSVPPVAPSKEPGISTTSEKPVQQSQYQDVQLCINTALEAGISESLARARCQQGIQSTYTGKSSTKNASVPSFLGPRNWLLHGDPGTDVQPPVSPIKDNPTRSASSNTKPYYLETYDWTINAVLHNL